MISDPEEDDREILAGFLKQYYNDQPHLPEELYLPLALPDEKLIGAWLMGRGGRRVSIFNPQRGEKLRLVDLAARNARLLLDELLIQKKKVRERLSKSVTALKDDLHLTVSPRTIACVDISNTGDSDAVGSLVYFENGKPKKSMYRHFKIKQVTGQDDFAMMREVVGRYFYRLREEAGEPPMLLVVDGGKGQLSSVVAEIESIGFEKQPVISLAKKFEEVYVPGGGEPLSISKSSPGLRLLMQIRDEAHRFAIEYNRKVRRKRTIRSTLDKIDGIGPRRRELLLNHFGSVKKIREATRDEIMTVKGIPRNVAELVYRALH